MILGMRGAKLYDVVELWRERLDGASMLRRREMNLISLRVPEYDCA